MEEHEQQQSEAHDRDGTPLEDDPAAQPSAAPTDDVSPADNSTPDDDNVGAADAEGESTNVVQQESSSGEFAGDADTVTDEGDSEPVAETVDWDQTTSAHRIAVELKRIESSVRSLLENRDPRRKRRLTGTRRWLDLQEDIVSWYGTDRFDRQTLAELQRLVTRRHHLFRRLRFLASTRGGWNT